MNEIRSKEIVEIVETWKKKCVTCMLNKMKREYTRTQPPNAGLILMFLK